MKYLCLAIVALLLQGCGMLRVSQTLPTRVEVCKGVFYELLPANKYPREVMITQIVDISHRQEKRSFLIRMEISPKEDALKFVGVTRFGLKVLEVTWNDGTIYFWKSDQIPEEFSPVYLLADIQLALWPLSLVQEQLSGRNVRFQQLGSMPTSRVLSNAKGDIITIHFYENDEGLSALNLRNVVRQYDIHVNTVSIESL